MERLLFTVMNLQQNGQQSGQNEQGVGVASSPPVTAEEGIFCGANGRPIRKPVCH